MTDFEATDTPQSSPKADPKAVEVIHFTQQEWDEWVAAALADLGLTWDELADQAGRDDFATSAAKALWIVVGHR